MPVTAPSAPPSPPRASRADERRWLERLHRRYHHRRFVSPDPLEFLYRYDDVRDREVAGLIASALAYGNVKAMRPAIERVLAPLGTRPSRALAAATPRGLRRSYRGFRYRVTPETQLVGLLLAMRSLQRRHGSLEACATAPAGEPTALPALGALVDALADAAPCSLAHLVPHPDGGSACKRLNLFLRWMVRADAVDPGGWTAIRPAQLVMPLDTHVYRTARGRGWTARRTPDLKAALAITDVLRSIRPDDPLRYDFALTRPGIRGEPPVESGDGKEVDRRAHR
jgi:uncharacterized protein (TIGR02757 family)